MAEKELYAIGEIPPLGFVPKKMHAYVIRPEHHGLPLQSMKPEVVDVPEIGPDEILVQVVTAGVNYNGVWAALGKPASPTRFRGSSRPSRRRPSPCPRRRERWPGRR